MTLLTVGHGPQGRDDLGARLSVAGVDLVVDVRRFPGSRNNPDVAREALEEWLPAAGIGYRWDDPLGGPPGGPPGGAGGSRRANRWPTTGGPWPSSRPTPPTPARPSSPPPSTRCWPGRVPRRSR